MTRDSGRLPIGRRERAGLKWPGNYRAEERDGKAVDVVAKGEWRLAC